MAGRSSRKPGSRPVRDRIHGIADSELHGYESSEVVPLPVASRAGARAFQAADGAGKPTLARGRESQGPPCGKLLVARPVKRRMGPVGQQYHPAADVQQGRAAPRSGVIRPALPDPSGT